MLAACAGAARPAGPAPAGSDADILRGLSLRDRAAQLVMPWMTGAYAALDDAAYQRARRWVDSLHVGGVIVSIGPPHEIAARLAELQRRAPLPLLVGADLEGGAAFRITGATAFVPNMGIAAGGRDADAFEVARVTAAEARAVGIHMAFAPVADVNSNPANPIINVRSFGEDPAAVARFVGAAVRGLEAHGMLAVAKHFPGHGDTETDSHVGLPVVNAGWPRLDAVELAPFRAAIAAGATGIMSSHIALPALAPSGRPATLEPAILTGVLRDSLRFRGLVVTDALDMAGVVEGVGGAEAAVRALEAGADLLLMPADPGAAIDAVVAAVEGGRLEASRIDASVRRILALKRRLGLFQHRSPAPDSIALVVGAAASQRLAADIAARALVLVRDGGEIDSLRARPRRVAVVAYGDDPLVTPGAALAAALRRAGHTVSVSRLWAVSGPASYDSVAATAAAADLAIFTVAVRATARSGVPAMPAPLAALVDSLAAPRLLLSLGSPYLLLQAPRTPTYILGWAANPLVEQAAADALLGRAAFGGRLPVGLPPLYPAGAGIARAAQ